MARSRLTAVETIDNEGRVCTHTRTHTHIDIICDEQTNTTISSTDQADLRTGFACTNDKQTTAMTLRFPSIFPSTWKTRKEESRHA